MSQIALIELTMRESTKEQRIGEVPLAIEWAESADMRDVKSQELTIGGLQFTVPDYGDRRHTPSISRNSRTNVETQKETYDRLSFGIWD